MDECRHCGQPIVEDIDAPFCWRHEGTVPVDEREEWARGALGEELIDHGFDHLAEPT